MENQRFRFKSLSNNFPQKLPKLKNCEIRLQPYILENIQPMSHFFHHDHNLETCYHDA